MFKGLDGVMFAQPITDIIAFILTMIVLYKVVQEMRQMQIEQNQ
jgi:hypothetical protein